MAWFVHYWDEINNRNISSSEISTQEDAMQKACNLTVCGKTWKLKFFSLLRVIAFGVFDRSRRFLVV